MKSPSLKKAAHLTVTGLSFLFFVTLFSSIVFSTPVNAFGYEGAQISQESFADLGPLTIINPATAARDLVIVLAADTKIPDDLYRLANAGHLIAYVPLQQFIDRSAANKSECIEAVTLLDVFSQHVQQQFHFARYQRPILIGLDGAAPFALATIAQAPNHLFQAGVGVNFQPEINLPAPPCEAAPLSVAIVNKNRYRITTHNNPTPWQTLDSTSVIENFLGELAVKNANAEGAIDDLPLVELPVQKNAANKQLADVFVILLSGDGGWANIDKDIGEALVQHGLPVVGWNSLQYFWREKKPEQAGKDLARAIAHYQKLWQRPRVVLVGFSLGADVLPFMINRLPDDVRSTIADTVFLGLAHKVDFQFHVTDWLGGNNVNAHPIAPELAKLAGSSMLCIYGKDDEDTVCDEKPSGVETVQLPGDHHFNGDYERATQLILDHLHRHSAP